MGKKIKVLVFPCGSEIGLELYRSLKYSTHVDLWGASSINDHGKFVYENYIGGIPFFDDPGFIPVLKNIVKENQIDAIYPAMDAVLVKIVSAQKELGCKVISSPLKTTEICLSKKRTYELFRNLMKVPRIFNNFNEVKEYPVFMKPDVGYGSRGAQIIGSSVQGLQHLKLYPNCLILENLPGEEYTVDCFTNRNRQLLFSKPRKRNRISNGISVNTIPVTTHIEEFEELSKIINQKVHLRGAWFYQVKRSANNELVLLEIASRLAGSSSLYRATGVNFALLSIFDAVGVDVDIINNIYEIELDRALDNKYKINIEYSTVYVDFDDCLLINGKINAELVAFLYHALNNSKRIILISKNKGDLIPVLKKYRIDSIFDKIFHLREDEEKFKYVTDKNGIFIDDSFYERKQIYEKLQMRVFSPDMVEIFMK